MTDGREEKPLRRFAGAARRLNHQPDLLRSVRLARERLLGGDQLVDRLSTARGRPPTSPSSGWRSCGETSRGWSASSA